jgi:hypothetical protein
VYLVSHFTQKILGFDPSFCRIKLNTMQNFWQKGIPSSFWILASKGKKKSLHPPHEKFGILDETEHTQENFGILYFIIPK